jgi:phage terminase large subunit-like protein
VSASGHGKIAFATNRMSAVEQAFEALYEAVISGDMTHDGTPAMIQHGLNAVRVRKGGFVMVTKEFNKSSRKIDLLYATMLAWAAKTELRRNNLPHGSATGEAPRRGRVILLD